MRIVARALSVGLAACALACTGMARSEDPTRDGGVVVPGRDGASPMRDGASPIRDGGGVPPDEDGGTPPPFDAGPCAAALADGLSVTPVSGVSASGRLFGAPLPGGGAVAAWVNGGGITLQRLGGDGSAFGAATTVAGTELHGMDASPDTLGVQVARGADALYFVGVGHDGSPRFEVRLLGEVDHGVTNNEWFGALIREGRLLWTGSEWAAYYTVNRLWPDGIAHYGDQLRTFAPDGSPTGTLWDWGCSHSMEVRIEHNGTILGPVCLSDCYPSKGIHFNHRSAMLYTDESGSNCSGGYGTSLGGIAPMSNGFWVAWTATDARASHDVGLSFVGNDRSAGPPIWLTTDAAPDGNVHAAPYASGFIVAWTGGGTDRIARFASDGSMVEGPVDLPAARLADASDFFLFEGGDVGWVTSQGATLALARLRACE